MKLSVINTALFTTKEDQTKTVLPRTYIHCEKNKFKVVSFSFFDNRICALKKTLDSTDNFLKIFLSHHQYCCRKTTSVNILVYFF